MSFFDTEYGKAQCRRIAEYTGSDHIVGCWKDQIAMAETAERLLGLVETTVVWATNKQREQVQLVKSLLDQAQKQYDALVWEDNLWCDYGGRLGCDVRDNMTYLQGQIDAYKKVLKEIS